MTGSRKKKQQDLAERKPAAKQDHDSRKLYQTMAERSFAGVYVVQDGKFRFINSNAASYARYKQGELIGRKSDSIVHPEDRETVKQNAREMLQGKRISPHEFRVLTKDGEIRWILETVISIMFEGKPAILGNSMDITEHKMMERALRESEEKYRTLIERTSDLVFAVDQGGLFTYINPMLERITGHTTSELEGKPFTLIIAPELRESTIHRFKKGIKGENVPPYEADIIHKNGTRIPVEFVVTTLHDKNGRPTGRFGIGRDITERKQAEEVLRESEKRLSHIFLGSPIPTFVIGRDHRVIYWNQAMEKLSKIPAGKMIGTRNHWKAFYGHDRPCMADLLVDQKLEDIPQWYGGKFEKSHLTEGAFDATDFFPALGQNGRWIRFTAAAIRDSQGNILGALETLEDITERKSAENELKTYSEEISDLYHNAPCGYHSLAPDGTFLRMNDTELRWLGYSRDEMIGKMKWSDLLTRESINVYYATFPVLKARGWIDNLEFELIRKDGSILPVLLNATAMKDEKGHFIMSRSTLFDITDRKRLEEERRLLRERLQRAEKMEALGTLAGGVAHDLNNVLGILVGYSELLVMETPEGSPLRRHAHNILQGGERAAAIIQDLLSLARRGVPISETVNLNRVVLDFLRTPEFEAMKIHHPGVAFKMKLEQDLLNIKGSPVHIGKTLMNLMTNAAEAITGKGTVTIRTENSYLDRPISGYESTKEGEYAVLTVSDTGEGISAVDIEKIFEPFYTKKVMGRSGTGLGLAVVWGTVKDHDGYIDVKSEQGQGSIFTLYFPTTREALTHREEVVSLEKYLGRGESILVVDDVEGQRLLASAMLSSLGYNVHSAAGGEEAVEYVKTHPVDLIVLDMIMDPGIDGLETYKQILEIRPHQKAIIVSGFAMTDRVNLAQELGAGTYVRKPYLREKIGLAVRQELDRR